MNYVITGGARFNGSARMRYILNNQDARVLDIDKLAYTGNLESLTSIATNPRYGFVRADNLDSETISSVISKYLPDVVIHFAAESFVDRSIDGPREFVNANIVSTSVLIDVCR